MTITAVENETGDRDVLDGTGQLIGWIEKGRPMIDSRGPWTEWAFTPANDAPRGPVRRSYNEAREDARLHEKGLNA